MGRGHDHRRAIHGGLLTRTGPRQRRHLATTAVRDGDGRIINGRKRWNTGVHWATHDLTARTLGGEPGQAVGLPRSLVPTDTPGFTVPYYWWTFNMPS